MLESSSDYRDEFYADIVLRTEPSRLNSEVILDNMVQKYYGNSFPVYNWL